MKVVLYPNKILSKVVSPVTVFKNGLAALSKEMIATMYAKDGIGLAAPQVDIDLALCVVDVTEDRSSPKAYANPKILEQSIPVASHEGCLSVPGAYTERPRFNRIKVQYQDMEGNSYTENMDGLLAIAIQHECDHLNGKLFMDVFGPVKRRMLIEKYKKHVKQESRKKE